MAKRVSGNASPYQRGNSMVFLRALNIAGFGFVIACVLVSLGLVVLEAIRGR
jgi:hypothetical protein